MIDAESGQLDMTLDIGQLESRWVGEFDLAGTGIEDYPVDVSVSGDTLKLRFSAVSIDFDGRLSEDGESFTGRARQKGEGEDWELSFERAGTVSFSDEFLKLEAVAADPDAVQPLAADARELREAFNSDKDQVRLVLLLSPS